MNSYGPSGQDQITTPHAVPALTSAQRYMLRNKMNGLASTQDANRGLPPAQDANRGLISTQDVKYAGFWVRLGAHLIDAVIVTAAIGSMAFVLAFTAGFSHMNHLLASLMINGLALLGVWFYFAGMESGDYQATCGKMEFGLQVTDTEGRRLSFWRATGRYFAKILSALPFNIGYLMIGFTEKKQGLHDILAGTVVVKRH